MLVYLHIRGLALLDDVALELGPGMNVLTGETGAGKSIIVDALMLLRGARGRAELVRKGASAARVEAQFELEPGARDRIAEAVVDLDLDPSWREGLVLERVVGKAGRGRSVIHARLTTLGMLERVGGELVDICSQHEHHSLTQVSRHLDLLDAYASLDGEGGLRRRYAEAYERWQGCRRALADLEARAREGVARADYIRFQLEEIDRVAPEVGEYEALRDRVVLLRDAQRWVGFARQAHEMLYEADDAIAARLAGLVDEARRGPGSSRLLAEIGEQLATAQIACEEAASAASRFASEIEIEPGELDLAEERLHELEGLRRKHRVELGELAARAEQMREELAELDNADDRQAALAAQEAGLRRAAGELAGRLDQARRAASERLAREIEGELRALHLGSARLEVRVDTLPEDQHGPRGRNRVELLFTANPGEPAASLSRVASGGELSRVLLAFKGVLATGDHVTTYVFDEVDAGVGGAVAEAIGRRLYRASRQRQVLCITHLPQIAAFADAHFRVEKLTEGGRTTTRVTRLDEAARVEELARMLGGARVTASAREHAAQLLEEARKYRRKEQARGRELAARLAAESTLSSKRLAAKASKSSERVRATKAASAEPQRAAKPASPKAPRRPAKTSEATPVKTTAKTSETSEKPAAKPSGASAKRKEAKAASKTSAKKSSAKKSASQSSAKQSTSQSSAKQSTSKSTAKKSTSKSTAKTSAKKSAKQSAKKSAKK
ncbi:MAG: DNA repair protein RecN, partial [Myxococcales bacterium]|nr:DNA repair protein RecN [Myxococcales bacterium]